MPSLYNIMATIYLEDNNSVLLENPNAPGGPQTLMTCSYVEYAKIAYLLKLLGYRAENVTFEESSIHVMYTLGDGR